MTLKHVKGGLLAVLLRWLATSPLAQAVPPQVAWSPDGTVLAFAGKVTGLRVWTPSAGFGTRLIYGGNPAEIAWAPSGKQMAFCDLGGRAPAHGPMAVLIGLDGKIREKLSEPSEGPFAWATDEQSIAGFNVLRNGDAVSSQLVALNLETKSATKRPLNGMWPLTIDGSSTVAVSDGGHKAFKITGEGALLPLPAWFVRANGVTSDGKAIFLNGPHSPTEYKNEAVIRKGDGSARLPLPGWVAAGPTKRSYVELVSVSPSTRWLLVKRVEDHSAKPSLQDALRIAYGEHVERPAVRGPSDLRLRLFYRYLIVDRLTGKAHAIAVVRDPWLNNEPDVLFQWSGDSKQIALAMSYPNRTAVWVCVVPGNDVKKIFDQPRFQPAAPEGFDIGARPRGPTPPYLSRQEGL